MTQCVPRTRRLIKELVISNETVCQFLKSRSKVTAAESVRMASLQIIIIFALFIVVHSSWILHNDTTLPQEMQLMAIGHFNQSIYILYVHTHCTIPLRIRSDIESDIAFLFEFHDYQQRQAIGEIRHFE